MQKNGLVMIAILSLCLLAGCGQKLDADVNTIIVEKDGTITRIEVEDYSQLNYDELKVKEMVEMEVGNYNKEAGEEKIEVEFFSIENSIAKLILSYRSAADYMAFTGETFFVGTIEEALAQGYDMNVTLVDQEEQKSKEIAGTEITELKEHKVVISEEPVRIRTYHNMKYFIPEGIQMNKKELDAANINGLSYIIL